MGREPADDTTARFVDLAANSLQQAMKVTLRVVQWNLIGPEHLTVAEGPRSSLRSTALRANSADAAIVDCFGTPVTETERGWLDEIRNTSPNSDPRLTARSRSALPTIFG